MKERELEAWVREELKTVLPNIIWRNEAGEYEVFGRYKIARKKDGYHVVCHATDVGLFSSTKSAISWCVADKYRDYNLARQIQTADSNVSRLRNDIVHYEASIRRAKVNKKYDSVDIWKSRLYNANTELEMANQELQKSLNSAKYIKYWE